MNGTTLTVSSPKTPPTSAEPRPYTPGVDPLDRLYDLLPAYIRARDMDRDQPLRALLRVMAEPLLVLEDDIARLYENWFIETCDAWAVPYVSAPVGYSTLPEPSLDGLADLDGPRARRRFAELAPRREAANTLAYRRRKGTLTVFQQLANDLTGWPSRAVEFRDRTAVFQNLNNPQPDRGRTIDIRCRDEIGRGFGPFSTLSRTIDVRSAGADPWRGRGKVGDIGLYVWPLRLRRVVRTPAHWLGPAQDPSTCRNDDRRFDYTFSVMGNRAPLYRRPLLPHDPARVAAEVEIAAPIRREAFREHPESFYGTERSLQISKRDKPGDTIKEVPVKRIVVADLTLPATLVAPREYLVAVDPEHGLLTLVYHKPPTDQGKHPEVWVSYRYGAPGDLGGGDYFRLLETGIVDCGSPSEPVDCDTSPKPCRVFVRTPEQDPAPSAGEGTRAQPFATLDEALAKAWKPGQRVPSLVIEILDDALYALDQGPVTIGPDERLEIRAAQGRQPTLTRQEGPLGPFTAGDAKAGGMLVLDGLLVMGAKLAIEGPLQGVAIRHCTLVPGLAFDNHGDPRSPNVPTLVLCGLTGSLSIDHSIVGAISVWLAEGAAAAPAEGGAQECPAEPPRLTITDSILDNASGPCPALGGKTSCAFACVRLWIERSTVFGPVNVDAVERAQDTLFVNPLQVAHRRQGCLRFCFVPVGSTTPARYRCQPDLALAGPRNPAACGPDPQAAAPIDPDQGAAPLFPRFRSRHYGDPDYALLAPDAPLEVTRGAEDLAEMGAFHDPSIALLQTNLLHRVAEYAPAGADVQIIEVFE